MMYYSSIASVEPIFQDLRQEETILQIALALEKLDKVSTDIFNHIKTHVSSQTKNLSNLQKRCAVVDAKVQKVTGSRKASQVFSSAKFPGKKISDFECKIQFSSCHDEEIKVKSKHLTLENCELKEKLQFFHVKYGNSFLRKNTEVTPEEGLGVLPNELDSVGSLLLFNTSENLYKQYVMLDPLKAVGRTRQTLEKDDTQEEIVAAPLSMSQTDHGLYRTGINYFYSPELQEIPQLDVPLDLPDLPGVAGDLQFLLDSGPPIAPSVMSTLSINSDATSPIITDVLPTPSTTQPLTEGILSNFPLVPPPPPPPILPELINLPEVVPEEIKSVLPIQEPPAPAQEPIKEIKTPIPTDDVRSSLMEAIRNAGGLSNLRSVVDRKQEVKRMKQEEEIIKPAKENNLMADLHATLAMRRKGISGTKTEVSSNPMERMLTIVPPMTRLDSETEDECDAEWEDE